MLTQKQILAWLEEVKDPEIPVLSLVDLGIINTVEVNDNQVKIEITPTFVGCPALEVMRQDIKDTLLKHGARSVEVEVNYKQPWTSDRLSERGREALRQFGLAPPPKGKVLVEDLEVLENVPCPRCGSTRTGLKNPFGPTLCRSIHYCMDCREAFEQFKPV
ncbi:MAG: phenylacetate-CoA oxygenase subunit PaaJ [Cyclobacteriaceae bacterium]|nr:MAG: phenylacetate-CoA oxygenase subunit PaaJ [Cyclobacteriaceae bacterium]